MPDSTGTAVLVDLIRQDWDLFDPELDRSAVAALLNRALGQERIAEAGFGPHKDARSITDDEWRTLREELAHRNRWFKYDPRALLDGDKLKGYFGFVEASPAAGQGMSTWYRARVCPQAGTPFGISEMGAPPQERATHGRVNPAGIPYLYLADSLDTAICEARPHVDAEVCVATFNVEDIRVLDLVTRVPRSPFQHADGEQIRSARIGIGMLERIGQELSRPVSPHSTAYDYSLTQYVCECAKDANFRGVLYRSAVRPDGINLALFDPALAAPATSDSVQVVKVSGITFSWGEASPM